MAAKVIVIIENQNGFIWPVLLAVKDSGGQAAQPGANDDQIVMLGDKRRFRISGLAPIHDIEQELEIEIDNEEVSTFGGLITGELGHIPEPGERLNCHGLNIIVDDVDERRVIAATVELAKP